MDHRLTPALHRGPVRFAATAALHFALNRVFAFRSDSLLGPAPVRYVLLVAANLLVTVAMVRT